jgi:hypothetical protein
MFIQRDHVEVLHRAVILLLVIGGLLCLFVTPSFGAVDNTSGALDNTLTVVMLVLYLSSLGIAIARQSIFYLWTGLVLPLYMTLYSPILAVILIAVTMILLVLAYYDEYRLRNLATTTDAEMSQRGGDSAALPEVVMTCQESAGHLDDIGADSRISVHDTGKDVTQNDVSTKHRKLRCD